MTTLVRLNSKYAPFKSGLNYLIIGNDGELTLSGMPDERF